jgi:hypothetical protein
MAKTAVPTSPHAMNVAAMLTGQPVLKHYRADIELNGDDYTEELCGESWAIVLAPNAEAAVEQVAAMIAELVANEQVQEGRWDIGLTGSRVSDFGLITWREKRAVVSRVIGDETPIDLSDIDSEDDDE